MNMVEKVARALVGWTPNVTSWADCCDSLADADLLQKIYHERARPAIDACAREIFEAGYDASSEDCYPSNTIGVDAAYQKMIDAALSEG